MRPISTTALAALRRGAICSPHRVQFTSTLAAASPCDAPTERIAARRCSDRLLDSVSIHSVGSDGVPREHRTHSSLLLQVARTAGIAPRTQPTLLAKSFRVFSTVAPPGQQAGQRANSPNPAWQVRMLYDGDCPLCMREVNMLRRRDKSTGNIDFVDISSPEYVPAENAGISYEQVSSLSGS